MAGSTISSTVGATVTLGSSAYLSPLTITAAGTVLPAAAGLNGAYGVVAGATTTLINAGLIAGGYGGASGFTGGPGGLGVMAYESRQSEGVMLSNAGTIIGGAGGVGSGGSLATAGRNGDGLRIDYGTLLNSGTIIGGSDATSASTIKSQGGYGAYLQSGVTAINTDSGVILGGAGGSSPALASSGGAGIRFTDAQNYHSLASAVSTLLNYGLIAGGAGGENLSQYGWLYGTGGTGLMFDRTDPSGQSSVLNAGTIAGGAGSRGKTGGTGVSETGTVMLTNTGVILGGTGGGTYNSNYGMGGAGVLLYGGSTLLNLGTITGGDGASALFGGTGVTISGATLINAGTIGGGHYANGYSGLAVEFTGPAAGTLVLDPGAVFAGEVLADAQVQDALVLAGTSAATVSGIGTSFSKFRQVDFAAGAAWTVEDDTGGPSNDGLAIATINGFTGADTLVMQFITTSSFTYEAGTGLVLSLSSGATETLDITGSFSTSSFIVTNTAAGTQIELCYLRGTRILTPTGPRAVEALRPGDAVVTKFSGVRPVKWIGRQGFTAPFLARNKEKWPVRIAPGALAEGIPARDLYVSPGHSLLLGGRLILAKNLINGITVTQDELPEHVDYYAIELQTHDCLSAEGCDAETFADGPGLRRQFHNAAEFHALYPGHEEPDDITLCAARPLHGKALEQSLRPVAARAARLVRPGPLRGLIERIEPRGVIVGWAQDVANPYLPVLLDLLLDGQPVASTLACDPRPDLAAAGIGIGHHQFTFRLPDHLTRRAPRLAPRITIRRQADGAALSRLEAAGRTDTSAPRRAAR